MGMVVKYADNILKNFANALSVTFTVIGAMLLFGQYPSIFFLFGVMGVLLSVFMYGKSTPSGFGAFESCYRTTSIANLQMLLQSGAAGMCLPAEKSITSIAFRRNFLESFSILMKDLTLPLGNKS